MAFKVVGDPIDFRFQVTNVRQVGVVRQRYILILFVIHERLASPQLDATGGSYGPEGAAKIVRSDLDSGLLSQDLELTPAIFQVRQLPCLRSRRENVPVPFWPALNDLYGHVGQGQGYIGPIFRVGQGQRMLGQIQLLPAYRPRLAKPEPGQSQQCD